MLKQENFVGNIGYTTQYINNLATETIQSCFGVAGVSKCSIGKRLKDIIIGGKSTKKGIYIAVKNNKILVDVHIIVVYGTNIKAITNSIVHKLSYTLEQATGKSVDKVNVYIDNIK
ncbi:MAG: Asp23/Gls24 family envelope stress response protein [Oscillospiraceae bacterium]|jgi:uncharacterized alkaline shock family protein YloU|nr:Asp23/Gls24 family envelope stress response protein [Oscillospiraceae bacterium]